MRFPHEEVPGGVFVAGQQVLTGGAAGPSEKYHYGFKIYYVVIKRLRQVPLSLTRELQ